MRADQHRFSSTIALLFALSAAACGGGDSTEPNDPIASVTISPATVQLAALGETSQLSATVRTQSGANANATLSWQSSAPQIATVDANGLVRAIAVGSAQITASAGSVSGSAQVTVVQVAARVTLTPARDSIFTGGTLQLVAAAIDKSNAAIASPRTTWSSSDSSIASVSATGLVTGRSRGQARITVRVDTASAGTDIIVRLTSILAARDTVLSGTIQVDRFEVAAGRTVTLSGDLTLRAEGPVVINGTIRGDCRGVDIRTLGTMLVRGTVDNTCSDSTALGKRLRLVSGAEYTLDSARVFSTGETYITNDTTIVVDTTSLGSSSFASRRALLRAPANCSISGTFGQGFKHVGAASGSPFGRTGTSATAHINIQCSGDLALLSATLRASSGGDGGTGTTTTVGQTARGGTGGFGAHILLYSPSLITVGGSSFFGGNGGDGGAASSQPTQPGLASAVGADGGVPGGVFFTTLRAEFVGSPSRIGIGRGGRGGDAFAIALDGAHATTAADAQQGSEARARGGAGASSHYPTVLGALIRGQVQNAGNLTITGPVAGNGGDAAASPGNGGSSALVPRPHGGPGGNGEVQPGSGGDVRLIDNRGGAPIPVGTPGGTGNGTVRRGDGGVGVPDCVLPFHLGGNGGAGGKVDNLSSLPGADASGKRSLSVGKVEVIDALNGRDGRDGVPPGGGGTAGVLVRGTGSPLPDVDVGVSRRPGRPGNGCPPLTLANASVNYLSGDPSHVPFLQQQLTTLLQIVFGALPASSNNVALSQRAVSAAPNAIVTVSGNQFWQTFSGPMDETGAIDITFTGTFAGFPSIPARFIGRITTASDGRPTGITGTLEVGLNGSLPGGQSTTYQVRGGT